MLQPYSLSQNLTSYLHHLRAHLTPSDLLSPSFSFALICLHLPTSASIKSTDRFSWVLPLTLLPISFQAEVFLQILLIAKRHHLSCNGTLHSAHIFGGSISPPHHNKSSATETNLGEQEPQPLEQMSANAPQA